MNPMLRIKNAHDRLKCASIFTKSYASSIVGFVFCKLSSSYLMEGIYNGLPFLFRSADIEALKEVLINDEYAFLDSYLSDKPNLRVIDVGHHIGSFSLWLLSRESNATVFAIEADPSTFNVASENARLAKKLGLKLSVVNRAAWKNDDLLRFSDCGDSMGHRVDSVGQVQVKGISLVEILDTFSYEVDLMKIDIEGAEEVFLSGSEHLLRKVKTLVIEIHPEYCSEVAVMKSLKECFSNVERIKNTETDKPLLWCR